MPSAVGGQWRVLTRGGLTYALVEVGVGDVQMGGNSAERDCSGIGVGQDGRPVCGGH